MSSFLVLFGHVSFAKYAKSKNKTKNKVIK